MDLGSIAIFRLAGMSMSYQAARQQVIAENVANANTPAYRAKDLRAFEATLDSLVPVAPERTDPMHLAGTKPERPFREDRRPEHWERSPDGNAVSLEQEMIKAGETQRAYTMAANLYQKHMGMLRAAFGVRG